jgi:hypothetical protein
LSKRGCGTPIRRNAVTLAVGTEECSLRHALRRLRVALDRLERHTGAWNGFYDSGMLRGFMAVIEFGGKRLAPLLPGPSIRAASR